MSQEDKRMQYYRPVCVTGSEESCAMIDENNIVILRSHHAQTGEVVPMIVTTNTSELEGLIDALQHLLEHAKQHDERPKSVLDNDLAAMLNLKNIH